VNINLSNVNLNSLTPEARAEILCAAAEATITSKSIHFVGDNLADGLHKVANFVQSSTNVIARTGGKTQVLAAPAVTAASSAVYNCCGRIVTGIGTGCKEGYKAATAPRTPVVCFE
jgi:hypothetical protein